MENKERTYLHQFIPNKYLYLTKVKKIDFKGVNLKTDYLINIINELILKYYFHKEDLNDKEITFNMWSALLKKKYGGKYNYYIQYLLDSEFMYMVSDYYSGKKARTYKLNTKDIIFIKRCKVNDKILMKKSSKDFLKKTFINFTNSPIPLNIREKMVNDLYKVQLNIEGSKTMLSKMRDDETLSYNKYMKNYMSVDNIGIGNMFFKFDEYGRMHTNFTVLKKELRQEFITIDGIETEEIDLSNSQPLFLTVIMKENMTNTALFSREVSRYIELVQNGLIYEELIYKCGLDNRKDAKMMMYKVLFGQNTDSRKENKLFKSIFPTVFAFIKDYKSVNDDYKSLSHELQLLESDFIFNKVINHLIKSNPDIPVFTIHDSISFPKTYKNEVREVFDYYKRKILSM